MDHSKAVKEYTRSSADQDEPLPHELRPEPVLTMTMTYLISDIISRIDKGDYESQAAWYDFCWGRLRAVRKDIVQQQICDTSVVTILEQCARFHIACYDRLFGTSKSHFDDKINTETLVNCLQSLIHMYDDLRKQDICCPNEAEFNAYMILLKLNSGFLVSEYRRYSPSLKQSSEVKEAVKIHVAYSNNMFSTYFKITKQTTYLNACLMQRFFQHLRVQALNTIVKAYSVPNKVTNISVNFIMNMLKLDSFDDCVSFCDSLGLTLSDDGKFFRISRNDFYISENIYHITTPSSFIVGKRIPVAKAVVASHLLPTYLQHTVHDSFNDDGTLKPDAIDASDQEEKMLFDVLQRKVMLNKSISQTAKVESENEESLMMHNEDSEPSDHTEYEKDSTDMDEYTEETFDSTDDIFEDNTNILGKAGHSNEFLLQEKQTKEIEESLSDSDGSYNSTTSVRSSQSSFSGKPTEITPPIVPPPATDYPLKQKSVEPVESALVKSPIEAQIKLQAIHPPLVSPLSQANHSSKSSVTLTGSNPFGLIPASNKTNSPTFCTLLKTPLNPLPKKKLTIPRENVTTRQEIEKARDITEENTAKLHNKLTENMKKISAKKFLRKWKTKVAKIKAMRSANSQLVGNVSVKEHLKIWGIFPKEHFKTFIKTSDRLVERKKASLMIQLILHSDLIEKLEKNVQKVGSLVVNSLGKTSVRCAHSWGNVAQPVPVFWKLVFAIPASLEQGSVFPMKFRTWCKEAFQDSKYSELGNIKISTASNGVPVFLKVIVIEGLSDLKECNNLTSLVLITAKSLEKKEELEKRLEVLLSFKNHPIPISVLNIESQFDHISPPSKAHSTFFEQTFWTDSNTIMKVLTNLTNNAYLCNLKIKPFCNLLEICVEKLFDHLRQDRYFHDELDIALLSPNNVISIYNNLIEYIEKEIAYCYKNNCYGTAFEFEVPLRESGNTSILPNNYREPDFLKSLSLRCLKCKLQPFSSGYNCSSKNLLSFLRLYCDNKGCPEVVSTVIRIINPPIEDNVIDFSNHLDTVDWLRIIEVIVGKVLTSTLLAFKVVYRENVLNNLIVSRFWLEEDRNK